LYIEREAYDDVLESVAERAKSIEAGSSLDPEATIGPLVSEEQFEKVLGYLEEGQQEGAEAYVGGGRAGDRGYVVELTILTNTSPDMSVEREEKGIHENCTIRS
jgi:phenylacetaldehyde dehydrogenase